MAKTALTQLQEQIEAIRKEAYAAGYAAAMQAIRDFSARPSDAPVSLSTRAASPGRRGRRPAATKQAKTATRRPRRGSNAQMIAEILQAIAPRAVRPAEIRQTLKRDKGLDVAFTSIRHALGQLQQRGEIAAGEDKTWRYLGSSAGG